MLQSNIVSVKQVQKRLFKEVKVFLHEFISNVVNMKGASKGVSKINGMFNFRSNFIKENSCKLCNTEMGKIFFITLLA